MTEISRLQATQPLNNQPITPEQPEPKVSFKGAPDSFEKSSSNLDVAAAAGVGAAAGAAGANSILDKLHKFATNFSIDKFKNDTDEFKQAEKGEPANRSNDQIKEQKKNIEETVKGYETEVTTKNGALNTAKEGLGLDEHGLKTFEEAERQLEEAHSKLANVTPETEAELQNAVKEAEGKLQSLKTDLNPEKLNAYDAAKTALKDAETVAKTVSEEAASVLKELEVSVPVKYRAIAAAAGAALVGGIYAIGKLAMGSKASNAESLTPQE